MTNRMVWFFSNNDVGLEVGMFAKDLIDVVF